MVAINHRPALPRHMLDDPNDTTLAQTLNHRAAKRCHAHRVTAKRAISNRRVRLRLADIKQRQTIDIDTNLSERQRNRLGIHPRSFNC